SIKKPGISPLVNEVIPELQERFISHLNSNYNNLYNAITEEMMKPRGTLKNPLNPALKPQSINHAPPGTKPLDPIDLKLLEHRVLNPESLLAQKTQGIQ
ncbi:MAG: hypothetical protein Q8881_03595, partial [Sweet potato little leaf phytoplasma]|nr:hypothetical protein [Sweet potato little leaf phytoplasma]